VGSGQSTTVQERLRALLDANRAAPDVEVERELLQVRASMFARREGGAAVADTLHPPPGPRRFGVPSESAGDLDVARLRESISSYGSLQVRGLLDSGHVDQMRAVIDSALEAQEAAYSGADPRPGSPWFAASDLVSDGEISRQWVRGTGAVLAADSPRGIYQLLEMFSDLRIDELVTSFFGERPALSVEKTTLRRVAPQREAGGWHQDGQFLGANIRSLNIWIALSDCGTDAPGLELVPTRLEYIVQAGTEGAPYDWCISASQVEREFPGLSVRPEFKAGDALLFDHFLLHRTWRTASMTRERYAIESWFFAPSAYPPSGQTGLYI